MNILTVGLVIQDYALVEFTGMSKIVTLSNVELPLNCQIGPATTGNDLVAIYQELPLDVQTRMYSNSLLNRIEVNLLYKEVKLLSESRQIQDQYKDSRSANVAFIGTFLVLISSIGISWLYHLNTVRHGDVINANAFKSFLKVMEYLITGFV